MEKMTQDELHELYITRKLEEEDFFLSDSKH